MLRAGALIEELGTPTVSLVCEGFIGQAKTTSVGLGFPALAVAMVPGHVDVQTADELRANVLASTVEQVIAGLCAAGGTVERPQEPAPRDIVFTGTFEEVNRLFIENEWSDGLPVVPPTLAKVEEFLAFTDRAPNDLIGVLPPDGRAATVWTVAVNGVMAGCRPEYMPILLAVVEAMADPDYGVEHSGNTPGSETLIILNGPIIKELDFNYEQGVLRDGWQPNTSIGRFFRLYLRNVAGFLPNRNDKGTFGNTWRVVMPENEDALARIGWTTIAQDQGLEAGANAVTLARFTGEKVAAQVFGDSAAKIAPYLAKSVAYQCTWELCFTFGYSTGALRPLLVLSPLIAEMVASNGLSKADFQRMLFDHARIPAREFEEFIMHYTNLVAGRATLYDRFRMRKAPKAFGESADPDRLVPILGSPQDLMIAVSGDPHRSNCMTFGSNGPLGFPTAKRIALPRDWKALLRQRQ